MKNMKPNEAAAMAIQLFSQEARLCEPQRKIARTQDILVKPVTTPEGKFNFFLSVNLINFLKCRKVSPIFD
jgi:hypothetical protein